MVEIRQLIRLVAFGYENLLPNMLSYWVVAIIPEIMTHNLGVTDKEMLSYYCGAFFSSFFWGIMVGSFMWPTAVNYLSKRTAVFVGIIGLGFFNYLIGQTNSLNMIFFYRFLCGIFHNLNSVGKDFIYEFAKPKFRLYGFSIKTLFTFVASFIGPWAGYELYVWCDRSFTRALYYITLLFVVGAIIFIIVFYLDFTPGDADYDHTPDADEEQEKLTEGHVDDEDQAGQKGLWEVTKTCMKNDYLRNLIIVYFLTNGVYKTSTMICIWYMETPWEDQGYGVGSGAVSLISLISFIPASILVLTSPKFVPSKFSYKGFITFFIITLTIAIFLFPFARDMIPEKGHEHWIWISYVLLGFLFSSVPKLYSPFINYNLNNRVDKYSRTSLNSLTFILTSASAGVFATIVAPMLGFSLYNPGFAGHWYSKYLSFGVLDICLIISLLIIRKID